MSISLSIKDVPEDLAAALRERAARNHRSVQGGLMHIIAQASGLTTDDASYVWLAGTLGANFVTLDQRLASAYAD